MSELEISPIGGYLGAEVRGLDADHVEGAVGEALKAALSEHQVLFMPGLAPSLTGLRDLGGLFGPLEVHPYIDKVDETVPEVHELDSAKPMGGVRADVWHTDVTFDTSPPAAALLHMVECPPFGGDTMWIDTQAVYDSLSLPMQEFLTNLTCIHDDAGQGNKSAEHPVVRVHPDTGRRALYVNKQFSRRIPQLTRPESQALLAHLFRWQEQVKFSCRWRWSPGDVALWDERVTLHSVVDDTEERRLLRRVTALGDDPKAPEGAKRYPHHPQGTRASSDFYGIGRYEF